MFEMMNTDMSFGRYVTSIEERFDLASEGERQTKITRTTELKVKGWQGILKLSAFWIGLKNVHRYVFRNWGKPQSISVSESV
jgi:hypothetical protein